MASGSNWPRDAISRMERSKSDWRKRYPGRVNVVAVDDYVVERGLLTLGDTEFDINRVVLDFCLHRSYVEEEVTVVSVELGHVHLCLLASAVEALFHGYHIVNVSFLYLQHLVQGVGRIDGVAGPGYVAEIVFVALFEHQIYGKFFGLDVIDGIAYQTGVAIAGLVEGGNDRLLVVDVFFLVELLAVEEVVDLVGLGLLHGTGELEVGNVLVAYEVDVLDADTLSPVDPRW